MVVVIEFSKIREVQKNRKKMETPEEFYESIQKGEGFTYVDTVVNNITRKTMMTGSGFEKWNERLTML